MSHKLFFSIAIPTYGYNGNGADFLKFNFEKLFSQTFKDFEVIISDHSKDDTIKEVCDVWKDRLDIKHYFNDVGRGVISPNINNSLKNCNGEWIKVLFQDDFLYDKNSLEIQKNFIESNKFLKWLMTKFYHSNEGYTFYRLYLPKWNDRIWDGQNTMGCPSGLTLKNEDLILFDESLNWLMDCEYYYRLFLKYGEPYILDEITVVNRTWGKRLTDTLTEELKLSEHIKLRKIYD